MKLKLGICQLAVTADRTANIKQAEAQLREAARQGAQMAILPEMFTIQYAKELFWDAAEIGIGGESYTRLSALAKETGMAIIGGSIPERRGERLYNTCMAFDNAGVFLGKYSKAHLFHIHLPGQQPWRESDVVSFGQEYPLLLPQMPVKTGVCICYDIRFPEWQRLLYDEQVELIALPAAFTRKTGEKHWELLLRARALDNQCFVAGVAPAASQCTYGHSMVTTPDGTVLYDAGTEACVGVVEIDTEERKTIRKTLPTYADRRTDLYEVVKKK